jgi:hypothetical protein
MPGLPSKRFLLVRLRKIKQMLVACLAVPSAQLSAVYRTGRKYCYTLGSGSHREDVSVPSRPAVAEVSLGRE